MPVDPPQEKNTGWVARGPSDEQSGFPSTGLDSFVGYYLFYFYFLSLIIWHHHVLLLKFSSVKSFVCVVIPSYSAPGNR